MLSGFYNTSDYKPKQCEGFHLDYSIAQSTSHTLYPDRYFKYYVWLCRFYMPLTDWAKKQYCSFIDYDYRCNF